MGLVEKKEQGSAGKTSLSRMADKTLLGSQAASLVGSAPYCQAIA